jgi:tRNA(fMet)-specific endonuclease VapC
MNGKLLLDTNIVIALFSNEEQVIKELKHAPAIYIPSIVLGELYFGANKATQTEANLEKIANFASRNTILSCDAETARYYGRIKFELRLKGRPIPENDVWIAAIARQHDLTLISRDIHFAEIEALSREVW